MSGNVINIIVSEDVGDVIDFAIDRIHHMIYWADKENNCIERATYNGTLRELIFLTKVDFFGTDNTVIYVYPYIPSFLALAKGCLTNFCFWKVPYVNGLVLEV